MALALKTASPSEADAAPRSAHPQIIVVTSVLLVFISFWRAAAIVLCDMASTAYYIGGIVEHAIGKAAPWYIGAVMLFAYAVRGVYVESCAMFVRGGVYRVVKEAMGGTLAKLSVSALMFDYVLTGPISGVSAGQYIVGLVNELLVVLHAPFVLPPGASSAVIAIAITLYFWHQNILGIEESSDKAMKIMGVTTVMVVVMMVWCGITIWMRGATLPPFDLHFSDDALGWLSGNRWAKQVGALGIVIAFGHSILAMSGEESLAQVNREIAYPKVKNLVRAGFIIFLYSMLMTGLISFFAVLIIPDDVRMSTYSDNLIGGLAMYVVGPLSVRLALRVFVVIVGFLILAGAVNTAIVGSNGVLNRVAEDGVLPDWIRHPHGRYGTTYRIINLVVILQVFTIIASGGDVYALGEAYAFGVVWSFVFKALSMVMLRFKDRRPRAWRVPLNLQVGKHEWPIGLALIFVVLLAVALMNLVTKRVATEWGVAFTVAFFVLFLLSERWSRHRSPDQLHLEKFNIRRTPEIDPAQIGLSGKARKLVPVRDPKNLSHLDRALTEAEHDDIDVIVVTVKIERGLDANGTETHFSADEQAIFTAVVNRAEEHGKTVTQMVLTSNDMLFAIARAARELEASEVIFGRSAKYTPDFQLESFALRWGAVEPDGTHEISVRVASEQEDHAFTI
ncbi:MAG: amino acid permease [Deltaproteobacteria bacterium]|nr:amino acid permease [Deltaproteobacteria bacterium]MBI3391289.1 amino acid permease [Deltaproteobacteria bacterium]